MRNLDARWYASPEVFTLERERVFARTWQMIGPAARVAAPGAYVATEVAGLKLFALRGQDGILRAFRNVCRHRGARLLEEGAGTCEALRCPYHHWLYDHAGRLQSAPWFGEEPGFRAADWPLEEVQVAEWRGLLFVAIDPEQSLEQQLGDLPAELADEPIESYTATATERLEFGADWKIYTDNFVEGYHIPGIHPEFFRAIRFDSFTTTVHAGYVRMTAAPREGLFYRGKWLWMWPNWTLSLFAGGMNTSRINPLSAERTELVYDFWFADTTEQTRPARESTIDANLDVIRQDFEVCEHTHRNYATGAYRAGPLSPRHEQGVAWFQGKLAAALAPTPAASATG